MDQVATGQKKGTANGKDIAAFLSGANRHWPKKDLAVLPRKSYPGVSKIISGRIEDANRTRLVW